MKKKGFKKYKSAVILIGGIVTLLVVLLLLQLRDDALNEDAQTMLKEASTTESEKFYYLCGLDAAEKASPSEVGKQRFLDLKSHRKTNPKTAALLLPEIDLYCGGKQEGCLISLANKTPPVLNGPSFRLLKERYQHFLKMKNFSTPSEEAEDEFDYNYNGVALLANRVILIDALKQAKVCCPQKAYEELKILLHDLAYHLEEEDTLVGKMAFLSIFDQTLNTLFYLSRKYTDIESTQLRQLTQKQLSFRKPFLRLFAYSVLALPLSRVYEVAVGKEAKKDERNNAENDGIWTFLKKTFFRLFYKENIQINYTSTMFKNLIEASEMSETDLRKKMKNPSEGPKQKRLRNIAGSTINDMERPDFTKYILVGHSANNKIFLFNQMLGKTLTKENLERIKHPADASPAVRGKLGLCFDGEEHQEDTQCFPLVGIEK